MNELRHINGSWKKAEKIKLLGNTKIVTIKAQNPRHKGGILASFSNDVVTDKSWECANMSSCDSAGCESNPNWLQAISYGSNNKNTHPWGTNLKKAIPEIEPKAQWIWVSDRYAKKVWCRKTFSKLSKPINLSYNDNFANEQNR